MTHVKRYRSNNRSKDQMSSKKYDMDVGPHMGIKLAIDENVTVDSRVARLSITQDMASKEEIVASLRKSLPGDENDELKNMTAVITGTDELSTLGAGFRSKRRRSSAVSLPGLKNSDINLNNHSRNDHSTGNIGTSTSSSPKSQLATKKKEKKKDNKQISIKFSDTLTEKRMSVRDLRDLTLYLFHGTNNAPKWTQIENKLNLKKMIILFVPGLQPKDYDLSENSTFEENTKLLKLKHLKVLKSNKLIKGFHNFAVCAPGSRTSVFSAYNAFINVGLTKKEKEARRLELSKKKINIFDLLINIDQMVENEYPIHLDTPDLTEEQRLLISDMNNKGEDSDKWVDTFKFTHDGSHIFALDCEMCKAEEGLVLTRVSVINFNMTVVYDTLVKPDVPIIDYLTEYSGITEESLKNVTTKLKDVQKKLLEIISSDDILIGHSLQSDLRVLKLRHPRIVDTAVSFDHKAGPPFKPALKYLANEFLSKDIQNKSKLGHDSIEDSNTCLELVKLKILNGLAFGSQINTENLFTRLSKYSISSLTLNDNNPKFKFSNSTHKKSTEDSLRCNNDDEIFDGIKENIDKYDLFVGRLRGLEFSREYAKPRNCDMINKPMLNVNEKQALDSLNRGLELIYETAPDGTLIVMLSGSGDTRDWMKIMLDLNNLNKQEKQKERAKRDKEIEDAIVKARDGVVSILIKTETKNDQLST
ncbi:hypothetical protein TBLA_0C06960 [Henningerozyma blattae CBS 6284]|uniref:Exonuclease domain-containing protein n=1 Tax=Henningerozyma blattae (strain ATCC 34711 / CBS 6284 / DSM 70876 / NBRC 10599 / NRRL Y-10934 / UCD 77-7) TaxID=1071380 RepID=I2H286_HENB6|nr:hypothetical protein TBLA_0C06960 [Tetrapisispora blattae CBS 6284]CCH60488.1 hypothetical protein TBLA_0C06960 [Tetrapisispora blattae CBS 6284]